MTAETNDPTPTADAQVRTYTSSDIAVTFTARADSPCDNCNRWARTGEAMGFDHADKRVCSRCLP